MIEAIIIFFILMLFSGAVAFAFGAAINWLVIYYIGLFLAIFVLILKGVHHVNSFNRTGEVGNWEALADNTFYKVLGRVKLTEGSTLLVLEKGDGNLLCVETPNPPPEDALYVKKREKGKPATAWISSPLENSEKK